MMCEAMNVRTMIIVGTGTASNRPVPRNANPAGSSQTGRPSVQTNAAPRQIVIVASVTINGAMLNLVMQNPAKAPESEPTATPAPIAARANPAAGGKAGLEHRR
jgi:hypothetical protein